MDDLPLFASLEKSMPRGAPSSDDVVPQPDLNRTARLFAFPPHRDVRIVGKLLDRWLGLRRRFEYQGALRIFASTHEGPIRSRLARAGMSPREIDGEIELIRAAMIALNNRRLATSVDAERVHDRG